MLPKVMSVLCRACVCELCLFIFLTWPFRVSLLPNTCFILLGSEIEQLLIGGFHSTGKILMNFLFVFWQLDS